MVREAKGAVTPVEQQLREAISEDHPFPERVMRLLDKGGYNREGAYHGVKDELYPGENHDIRRRFLATIALELARADAYHQTLPINVYPGHKPRVVQIAARSDVPPR